MFSSFQEKADWAEFELLSFPYFRFQDKADWAKFEFSQEQVDTFWRDGFVKNIRVLTEYQCDRILNDYTYFTVSTRTLLLVHALYCYYTHFTVSTRTFRSVHALYCWYTHFTVSTRTLLLINEL
jgi:hypothetical protein